MLMAFNLLLCVVYLGGKGMFNFTFYAMKLVAKLLVVVLCFQLTVPLFAKRPTPPAITPNSSGTPVIQIALLLDTSNSMDGLINQAKTQLWNIVKDLTTTRHNGQVPKIEIALYQYGNDGLSISNGYIQQVSPFTQDLDKISDALFKLKTNGGSEYSPQAIVHACNNLAWKQGEGNLRFLFIAGNEPFAQGTVTPQQACSAAKEKHVMVTTIHCGDEAQGKRDGWSNLPECTDGRALCINTDAKQEYIATPYDSTILHLNGKLNKTYYGYGAVGAAGMANQTRQDANSMSVASANAVERAVAKSTVAYKSADWDVVDAVKENKLDLAKAKKEDLPKELQNLTPEQRKKKVEELAQQRSAIQKEIIDNEGKRQKYIAEQENKNTANSKDKNKTLQAKMTSAVREMANSKGFTITK